LAFEHEGFLQGDMTKRLPFDDATVDTLVCIDGIEHIKRQDDFVHEVSRVLKSGGEFIVSTPNISSLRSRWQWLMTGHHYKCNSPLDEDNPNPLHHVAMVSYPELRYLLHTNGIRVHNVTTNRIKGISWLYGLLAPFAYLWERDVPSCNSGVSPRTNPDIAASHGPSMMRDPAWNRLVFGVIS
jgi:SAM-dependent methyltransferase